MLMNQKVEMEMAKNRESQFGFPEFGQAMKEFKEGLNTVKNIWRVACDVFVSLQLICLLIALVIHKIRSDQWLWQMGSGQPKESRNSRQQIVLEDEDANSANSVKPKLRACGECRGLHRKPRELSGRELNEDGKL